MRPNRPAWHPMNSGHCQPPPPGGVTFIFHGICQSEGNNFYHGRHWLKKPCENRHKICLFLPLKTDKNNAGPASCDVEKGQPMKHLSIEANGQTVTHWDCVEVNAVSWRAGSRWPRLAPGGGSCLELIDARADNRLAANWAASDETAKSEWTTTSATGVLDNGSSTSYSSPFNI